MKKLGLSMSGGGVKGIIYLGLVKLLQERDIKIDVFAGLSSGSLIAGLLGSGKSIEEIKDIIDHLNIKSLIDINPFDGIEILDQKKVLTLLKKLVGNIRIEECNPKVIIFATNLTTHKLEVIESGDLATAMLGSCSLPPLFHPLRRGESLLAEGGFTTRFGAKYLRKSGAEYIVGADVNGLKSISFGGLIEDFYNCISSSLDTISKYEDIYDPVDIKIEDFEDSTSMFDFQKMNLSLIDIGYKTGLKYIDKIVSDLKEGFVLNLLHKMVN